MLLKSKATGRSNLHPDDRFYLEVRVAEGTTHPLRTQIWH